jgi:prepilin-type N-terminal cleavage/methylation domain-containing protein
MRYERGITVKPERRNTGLTLIELLIVLGIIALLVGLLLPALSAVRNVAKETKQKAQLSTIELALTAFKNDYGDYPPSNWTPPDLAGGYCGAQKLTEALLGWDLMGFHPDSAWRSDGLDKTGGAGTYDPAQTRDNDGDGVPDTFRERKGTYLELATADAFRLGHTTEHDGVFREASGNLLSRQQFISQYSLDPDRYVLCDSFGVKPVSLPNGKRIKVGSPILYYRANTSSKICSDNISNYDNNIYSFYDNMFLVRMGSVKNRRTHPLLEPSIFYSYQYGILDPKVTARPWPYRPDSYILISAGADGLYGTNDDVTNFGN